MLKSKITQNRILFALYTLLSLGSVLVVLNMLMGYSAGNSGKAAVALSVLSFLPALVIFAVLLPRWKSSPEKVFLLVAVPSLFAFAFLMLIGEVPDEANHIKRAFLFDQPGNDMMVPLSLTPPEYPQTYADLANLFSANLDLTDVVHGDAETIASYSPHLYIIPGVVMRIAVACGMNLYMALYLGRLVNVALYLVAGYWIIRIMPLGRVFMMVYLLNPMALHQQASLSGDALTNIAALLYIAFVLKARFSKRITRGTLIAIAISLVFTILSKYIYLLLAFLLLLLVPYIQNKKTQMIIYVGTIAATAIVALCALFVIPWGTYQCTFDLIKDPPECIRVLMNTIVFIGPGWVNMFFGANLGWLEINVWQPTIWAYMFIFAFSLVFNLGESFALKRIEKVLIVSFVVVFTIVMTLMLRYWATGQDGVYDYITGVQGRYFIPYINLALICFITPRSSLVRENCLVFYAVVLCLVSASALTSIVMAFV